MALPRQGLKRVSEFIELMDELDRLDEKIRQTRKACLLVINKCMKDEREPDPVEVAALRAIVSRIPDSKKIDDPTYSFLAHDVLADFRKVSGEDGS